MKINIYKDNPTSGGVDGTKVSCGDFSEPVHFDLDALSVDEQIIPLAVRCDYGFRSLGEVTISDFADVNSRYQLAASASGVYTDSITFAGVSWANVPFFAKARTIANEYASLDRSTKFQIDCVIERA